MGHWHTYDVRADDAAGGLDTVNMDPREPEASEPQVTDDESAAPPPPTSAAGEADDRLAGRLRLAGLASLGAGTIHALAVGMHIDTRGAAVAFTILTAIQLAWGVTALVRPGRAVAVAGIVTGAAAVGGWIMATTSGVSWINGLETSASREVDNTVAAGLAAVVMLLSASAFFSRSRERAGISLRPPLALAGVGVTAVTVFAMIAAGTSGHHAAGATDAAATAAGGAGHHGSGSATEVAAAADGAGDHGPSVAVPYDPALPIDLGGVPGVTPRQQAAAEQIVSATLQVLPQFSDPAVAEQAGFHSIGDGGTGIEHFVNEDFMTDEYFLDPSRPESLVYNTQDGGRRLVAAMYMADRGLPLEDVPDIGGALMQWHTHDNLCYNDDGQVRGLTDGDGNCPAGLTKPEPTPMIHSWIEPHPCGPFAALEGIGGGTIEEGEERLCDTAHGGG